MWRRAAAPGIAADPVEARALGACGLGQQLVAVLVEWEIVERHDVRRPLAGLGELELADLDLDVPRIVGAPLDPWIAEPQSPRAGELAELDAIALERPAVGADGTQGLALVDETPDLLGERLDRGQMKNFR